MPDGLDQGGVAPALPETVLIVDDAEFRARQIKHALRGPHRQVFTVPTAREALASLTDALPDLIIVHMDLGDLSGTPLLSTLRDRAPGIPVLALSADDSAALGAAAAHAGATDVLSLPINQAALLRATSAALSSSRGIRDLERAREQVRDRHGFSHMLTQSPRMLRVFDQIRAVASTDATVLILGETGTGKELVSRAIHERSRRRERPFISINCGAFTETLLESELFGHEKGSFTGAAGRRRGVFEMADRGTLFLDELGETSLSVQVNLLRVLEEMCFRRVGGQDMVNVDTRIVAATNADLERKTQEGSFREDLFYRLNVFPIHLPPLRERPEDISLLTRHFLDDAATDYGLEAPLVTPEAMRAITEHRWPGNVRQLRALCERWVIVAGGRPITLEMLPTDMQPGSVRVDKYGTTPLLTVDENVPLKHAVGQAAIQVERTYLHRLLKRHDGHLINTAQAAGITRRTLYTKMKLYGLDAADYRNG
jgi:two-component system, NtrC family, response regulator AtoC